MAMERFVVDIGNTRIKLGHFQDQELNDKLFLKTSKLDAVEEWLKGKQANSVLISSVRDKETEVEAFLKERFQCLRFDDTIKVPIEVKYSNPQTLGRDRLAGAIAGQMEFPDREVLTIDCGTCTTYNRVSSQGTYLGGNITPGVKMRLKAMHHFTGKLPLLGQDLPEDPMGTDTETSIQSGAAWGAIFEMRQWINHYSSEMDDLAIILTGGAAPMFESRLNCKIFARPFLVLQGLNEILRFNEK